MIDEILRFAQDDGGSLRMTVCALGMTVCALRMTGARSFFQKAGQAAVQYMLIIAVVSVGILGVVQARFNTFRSTMDSVKHQMAVVIGGGRRLPQRWYAAEAENIAAVASDLGPGPVQEGAGDEASVEEGGGGGGGGFATESAPSAGGGGGFFGAEADSGFGAAAPLGDQGGGDGASERGTRGARGADTGGFGAGGGPEGETEQGVSALGEASADVRATEQGQAAASAKKAEEEEVGAGDEGGLKAAAEETKEKRKGRFVMDWLTLVKLIIIIAVIVILVIMLLGVLGRREQEE